MRILGIDPGLNKCGWGVIESHGSNLKYIAHGVIKPSAKLSLAERLLFIDTEMTKIVDLWKPHSAAIEETFVNKSPASSLKLGQARGVAMVAPARFGIEVAEYGANLVKKTVVGSGHADKVQILMMIKTLLPSSQVTSEDAADALAVAICHANHHSTYSQIQAKLDSCSQN